MDGIWRARVIVCMYLALVLESTACSKHSNQYLSLIRLETEGQQVNKYMQHSHD